MRQTIGGTWLFQLMILFILLFSGYIILTIDYSKTVKVKNEVISMLEKYSGLNDNSIMLVNNYLQSNGYSSKGGCIGDNDNSMGIYGATSLDENAPLEEVQAGEKYFYCVKKYRGANTTKYYQVTLFYKFNLPVLGNVGSYTIKGTTANFIPYDDNASSPYCNTVNGTCSNTGTTVNKPSNNGDSSNNSNNNTYTVSFDLGGGSIVKQSVMPGGKVDKPDDPVKDGYVFNGWKLNGQTFNFYDSISSNMTLIADWKPVSGNDGDNNSGNNNNNNNGNTGNQNEVFTVTFDLNGGTSVKSDGNGSRHEHVGIDPQQVKYGEKVTKPNKPYKYIPSGTFMGWELNGEIYDFNTPVTSDITLKARWEKKVRVSFYYGECGMIEYKEETNETKTFGYPGADYGAGIPVLDFDYGSPLSKYLKNNILYKGPKYGDNTENKVYNYKITFGNHKSIKYWATSSGQVYDLNAPLYEDIAIHAVC